jgi:hypothetical protein
VHSGSVQLSLRQYEGIFFGDCRNVQKIFLLHSEFLVAFLILTEISTKNIMANTDKTVDLTDLSEDALLEICRAAQVIACECPGYLARLLRQVRTFRTYTATCIDQFPADAETHLWLIDQAALVEDIILQTMIELMKKENLIDDAQQVSLDRLSERAREIILKQVGTS